MYSLGALALSYSGSFEFTSTGAVLIEFANSLSSPRRLCACMCACAVCVGVIYNTKRAKPVYIIGGNLRFGVGMCKWSFNGENRNFAMICSLP